MSSQYKSLHKAEKQEFKTKASEVNTSNLEQMSKNDLIRQVMALARKNEEVSDINQMLVKENQSLNKEISYF